jgi:tetratricopeptide (TPR) repeat protein
MTTGKLPPRPDPITGLPRPPRARRNRAFQRAEHTDRSTSPPKPPPGQGPTLEWDRWSWDGVVPITGLLLLLGAGVFTIKSRGVAWVTDGQLWLGAVVLTLLALMAARLSYRSTAAGADWCSFGKYWVKVYELTEVKMRQSYTGWYLELTDADDRKLEQFIPEIQSIPELWDLVYNGILHSVIKGGAKIDQRSRDKLGLDHAILARWWTPEEHPSDAEHRLGVEAQWREEHEQALAHYKRSLAIAEEHEYLFGIARTSEALGILYTELGDADSAVGCTLRSLTIHTKMETTGLEARVDNDLRWLTRQRRLLGETRFLELLRDTLDESAVQNLLTRLEKETKPI